MVDCYTTIDVHDANAVAAMATSSREADYKLKRWSILWKSAAAAAVAFLSNTVQDDGLQRIVRGSVKRVSSASHC